MTVMMVVVVRRPGGGQREGWELIVVNGARAANRLSLQRKCITTTITTTIITAGTAAMVLIGCVVSAPRQPPSQLRPRRPTLVAPPTFPAGSSDRHASDPKGQTPLPKRRSANAMASTRPFGRRLVGGPRCSGGLVV